MFLKTVGLKGFKCFKDEVKIPLKQVTIMYGKNGRGKSTVSQSLLLLGQSMKKTNSLDHLTLNDGFVNQGFFEELVNKDSTAKSFEVYLEDVSGNSVWSEFVPFDGYPHLGRLASQKVNGKNTFEYFSGSGDGASSASAVFEPLSSVTSDNLILQGLKDAIYVSANRNGPVNEVENSFAQTDTYINPKGQNIINIIAEQGLKFAEELRINLSQILSGASLSLKFLQDKIELGLNSNNCGETLRPTNVGFGYSYVLPVIVAAMLAKQGSLVIIENPEAHLHSGAQSRLADFLITQAVSRGFQLIIETHSDHVVNGLRIASKQGRIHPSDSAILHFSHGEECSTPEISEIKCDAQGNLSDYPEDFMDEWTKQLLNLM